MKQYLARRILLLIPSLLAVYTITFFLMHATPGGPWDRTNKPLPAHVIARLNEKYGLDRPLGEQYVKFLYGAVRHGDLGVSYSRIGQDVKTILTSFFPVSLQLGALAMAVSMLVGVTLGILGAVKHNSWVDYLSTLVSVLGVSTPSYVVATLLIILLAVKLGWLPTGGWEGITSRRVLIPVFALSLYPTALLARYTRSSMLEVLKYDYVRTARAKGLRERAVLVKHALRNALIPVITVGGVALANVVTGSFFVESICAVPGIGRYFVNSVSARDYPVIMGTTLLYAAVVMLLNLVVDVIYVFLDPRVRYD